MFGKSQIEAGLTWFEYRHVGREKVRSPLSIAFAFVATHNHFVLDRGGKVFNRSAPIIKLREGATEDEHLALLGYLNSSTACFWMKQTFFDKGNRGEGGGVTAEKWEKFFEYDGTKLLTLPVPETQQRVLRLAALLDEAGRLWTSLSPDTVLASDPDPALVVDRLETARAERASLEARIRWLQEELDWSVYPLFGLPEAVAEAIPAKLDDVPLRAKGTRPCDRLYAAQVLAGQETARYFALCDLPLAGEIATLPLEESDHRRLDLIANSPDLQLIEVPAYKRTFREGHRPWDPLPALRDWVCSRVEALVARGGAAAGPLSLKRLLDETTAAIDGRLLGLLGVDDASDLGALVLGAAVPLAAPLRFTEVGLEKRALWERTWDLQRREDAGETLDEPIPVPPKYDQKDYRDPVYWRLRGKLDVPKERFISYPGAERDDDKSPLIGWAGWDHLQRAQALAALYQERKEEAWTQDRLAPLLAGLLELVPWLKQWHNDPDQRFGGQRLGDYFAQYVESEARANGLTLDDLRAWRPPAKGKGKKK
jgi:hypothetical protein